MSARSELKSVLSMRHVAPDNAWELIDALLREHAHELAQKQRAKAEEYESYGEVDRAEGWMEAANSIDPKMNE